LHKTNIEDYKKSNNFYFSCDSGYHGHTCTPTNVLTNQLQSDFSMNHQLDSDWLSVVGGAITGANQGCGTLLSGESLYFSKVSNFQYFLYNFAFSLLYLS
jgi:hypothetical protein